MSVAFGVIRTKLFALVLGVSGIGLLSQFTNFINLLNFVLPLGLPMSLTKFVAENEKENKDLVIEALENSLKIVFLLSVIAAIIFIVFSENISNLLTNSDSYGLFIIIIACLIPFSFLNSFIEAYVRGLKNINLLTYFLIASSTVSIVLTIPLVLIFKLTGAVISVVGIPIIISIMYVFFLKKNNILPAFKFNLKISSPILKILLKIGFASLLIGAINQITYLIIRIITIDNISIEANGIYQSVLSISLNYFSFLFIFISNYTFPKINEIKDDDLFFKEINNTFRVFIFILTPLVSFIIVFRFLMVNVFFSSDFLMSTELYKYQFSGDFFKALAWVVGLWLIPKNKIKLWVLLELVSFSLYPIIYYLLMKNFGNNLVYASESYLISNVVHFSLNLFFIKKYLKFKLSEHNVRIFFISILFIFSIILLSEWSSLLSYFIILPVLVIWAFVVSTKNEKENIKKLLKLNKK